MTNNDTGLTRLPTPQQCTFGGEFPELGPEFPELNIACNEMAEWAWDGQPICTKVHLQYMGDMNSDNANALAAVYKQSLEDCLFWQDLAEAIATNPETSQALQVTYFCKRGPERALWIWLPVDPFTYEAITPGEAGSSDNAARMHDAILEDTGLDTYAKIWTRPEKGGRVERIVKTAREIDRYPHYELSANTEGTVTGENEDAIVVRIATEGDSRLAGHLDLTYRRTPPYNELCFPYEEFEKDWTP